MTPGSDILERVRTAQAELGTGDPADALALVEPLLDETAEALRSLDFVARSPEDRRAVVEAFCYARVTAILALESVGATAAVGRIRALAAEALDVAAEGNDAWKVLCAAAEMLSRAGDADGAASSVMAAARLAPEDVEYVRQLRGSIRSMFPAAFADR
ncbi:MAG TPA: hypothetical protein VM324_16865 [Egibacteraceae bacterium]|nr:hypothetical protein [Egibacteraceae bacterium]